MGEEGAAARSLGVLTKLRSAIPQLRSALPSIGQGRDSALVLRKGPKNCVCDLLLHHHVCHCCVKAELEVSIVFIGCDGRAAFKR